MTMYRLAGLAIACALAATAACRPAENTNGPTNAAATNATAANTNAAGAPTFAPGSAQDIAMHQPDYRANVTVQTGPTKFDLKIAKLGEAWRIEQTLPGAGNTVTFIRPGQPTLQVMTDKKTYFEFPEGGGTVNPVTSTLQGLTTPGVTFEKIGTETVDKYQTTKFRGTKAGENGQLVLYAAPELRNLIIKVEAQKENVGFSATWSDVSLDVPADAVQPPTDLTTAYKKIGDKEYSSMFSSGEGGEATAAAGAPASNKP